ncbi:hypothetical protein NQ315_002013 [Exocentrus adspersus]|uniref:CCHC-type domain-containing protein n=1 Tax=Exocentrus adspersus TaxID=1586481 RepID=A0AAV8WA53_9CUCU|nr:hypothetical protein NQ315_002013 [Exocentrus adspersus]
MTRFARAKGSKASNERVPEEATSWGEMRQQLLDKNKEIENNKKQKDAFEQRSTNYKAFLEECEKDNVKNINWAEFPNTENSTNGKNYERKNRNIVTESDSDEPPEEVSSKIEIIEPFVAKKKKKVNSKKPLKITIEKTNSSVEHNEENGELETISQKINMKKKTPNDTLPDKRNIKKIKTKTQKHGLNEIQTNIHNTTSNGSQPSTNTVQKKRKVTKDEKNSKKQLKKRCWRRPKNKLKAKNKNKNQKPKIVKENLTEADLKKIEKKKKRFIKQLEKKKKARAERKRQKEEEHKSQENNIAAGDTQIENDTPVKSYDTNKNTYSNKSLNKPNKIDNKNKGKVRDNEQHPRKKPLVPHKMFINGKELEIDYVDGFPVKKEDALRLQKLRRQMISKGLPRSEINIALKLERRKAEKALAREKKKVCFHCRKSGHNLSECPDYEKNEVAHTTPSGICFKCGSTEHTHFECKVVRSQDFKFATCFICNEQGHIARQCPDNARGLYPKGGACNVCGDVTHLKKDCPKYQVQQEKQEKNMRIETLGGSNPDTLEDKSDERGGTLLRRKSPNKIIKF